MALLTPFPIIRSPVLVMGDKALNAAPAVVWPVPPLRIGSAVPEYVIAKVPDEVIGEPVTDRNDGTVAATEVTVPPGLLELIVWFGQVPVMVTLVPATKAGEVVPVPPLAMATTPVTLDAVPEVFWLKVGQVNVPVLKLPDCGVPRIGVTKVGEVANTSAPEPVSSVTAVAKLALVGVAKNVATPVPKPVMEPTAGVTVVFVTLVTWPWAFVAKTGICVAEP